MKRHILLVCALALPCLAHAWSGGPPPDRSSGQTMMLHDLQHRTYDQEKEMRRRDDEARRRAEEERQRETWRRDEERRRENTRRQDERARDWEQRQAYEEQRLERFQHELLQRDEQKRQGGKGKSLDSRELRRYDLVKPGDRP